MQSLQLSRQDAARELLRRRKARRSLIPFTEFSLPKYRAAAHHDLIAAKLEATAAGEIDRLMINMPPRHGKSELASRRFPAWLLGTNPEIEIVVASYNADKAREFGYEVRDIVRSPEYRALFPGVALKEDSRAADRWNTDAGGSFRAVGIGTALTGRGADVLLIDDPIKDDEEADSELRRERIWSWYSSVAYTRLSPGGRVIVIQTRWHEDDLTGRLLVEQAKGGDKWDILELPAISAKGEALWPDRYPLEYLERIKRVTLPRHWAALYQQRPAPDEGNYYKREWWRYYDEKPKHLRIYGASDYAVTDGGGDYTVHIVIGVDPNDNIYVLDLWRGQTASDVWIKSWLDLVKIHKPLLWVEEQGQIVKSIGPFLEKRMREERTYCRREQVASAADKPTRSRSIQARTSMGKVYLPSKAPWLAEFQSELLTFPAGKHDDQVDAFGLIGRMLDDLVPASVPKVVTPPVRDAYRKPTTDSGWRTV
jgi:predicted phage terminase large subunit-like protein